jgi:hypothetical protein
MGGRKGLKLSCVGWICVLDNFVKPGHNDRGYDSVHIEL